MWIKNCETVHKCASRKHRFSIITSGVLHYMLHYIMVICVIWLSMPLNYLQWTLDLQLPLSPFSSSIWTTVSDEWRSLFASWKQQSFLGISNAQVNPFSTWRLHVTWMYIWWVCTRAARKENPNPNPNTHDHCLLSKWKCRMFVHTHLCN